jgi:hypothetical protein
MGKNLEFNWILKLNNENIPNQHELKRGELREFIKEGERIYPLQKPIFLVNEHWEALATVYIRDYHLLEGYTKGNYIIEEILNEKERMMLNNLFKRMYRKD